MSRDEPNGAPEVVLDTELPSSEAVGAKIEEAPRYDLRVFRALRRIIRGVDLHSRRLQNEHQITGPQLVCLLSIAETPEITPSALSREVHLSPSTVNGILDRLETKGLVVRRRASKDRRLVSLSLTAEGAVVVANAPSPLQDTLAEGMRALASDELANIASALDRIVELMEVRHIDAAPLLAPGPIAQGEGGPSPGSEELAARADSPEAEDGDRGSEARGDT